MVGISLPVMSVFFSRDVDVVVVVVVVFFLHFLVCRHPYCLGSLGRLFVFSATNSVVQTFDLSSRRDLFDPL